MNKQRRRKSARRNRRTGFQPKYLVYVAGIALGSAVMGYAGYTAMGTEVADEFGCYRDPDAAHTLVLLDASMPRWNEPQQRSLERYLTGLYDRLGFNERLKIFTTEGSRIGSQLEPNFTACGSVGTPEELEEIGAGGASEGYLAKQKERLFEEVLAPELEAMLAIEPEDGRQQNSQSPILEQLRAVSKVPEFEHANRLVLISDLLQFSDSAQFCRTRNSMPPHVYFRERRIYDTRLAPESFEGVDVEILMIQRYGYGGPGLPFCRDEEELSQFWRDYFEYHGAASVELTRVRMGYAG